MSQEVQKDIIRVAGDMFFRLGIRSVSIDDICRELGMSKKTFYVYFSSKDELVDTMLTMSIDGMARRMEDLLKMQDFSELVKVFLRHQDAEKNDVRRVPQLVYDLKKYYPRQFNDFQHKSFDVQRDYIRRYLEQGVASGLVRADINIDMASMFFAKVHSDFIRDFEVIEAGNYNMHQLTHMAMDIFVRGILSEAGMKLYEN